MLPQELQQLLVCWAEGFDPVARAEKQSAHLLAVMGERNGLYRRAELNLARVSKSR